ncbi:ABC transporter substrate-binding protein [Chloroflexota bacterium]
MKKKFTWLIVSCLLVTALVLSSCTSAEEPTAAIAKVPKYGGELIVVLERPTLGFDDVYQVAWRTDALHFTSDQLLIGDWAKGPGGTGEASFSQNDFSLQYMTGNLAESWEIPDPDTVIFHIRKGVKWQDKPPVNGREFVAEDAAFSLRRACTTKGSYMHQNYPDWFESATATDKYTFVIKGHDSEKNRTATVFENIVSTVRPVAPEVIEKYGDQKDWKNVVGTGPYIIVDYVPQSSAAFDRNPDYHMMDPLHPKNRLPYPDKLRWLVIQDKSTYLSAMRTGKVDVLAVNNQVDYEQAALLMKTNPELQYKKTIKAGIWSIHGRMDKKPFDDIRVRRALQMAINNQEIADTYYGGEAELITWPVSPIQEFKSTGMYVSLEELPESTRELFEYHPDKAKQLLVEAGYPDGFKTDILIYEPMVELMEIYKAYWEKIGVELELDVKEYSVYRSMMGAKTYDQMCIAVKSTGSPMKFITQKPGHSINYSFTDDPYINERVGKIWAWENMANQDERVKLARENVLRILDQAYTMQPPNPYLYSFWQPWIGGNYGAYGTGYHAQYNYVYFTWVDQDIKETHTGKR